MFLDINAWVNNVEAPLLLQSSFPITLRTGCISPNGLDYQPIKKQIRDEGRTLARSRAPQQGCSWCFGWNHSSYRTIGILDPRQSWWTHSLGSVSTNFPDGEAQLQCLITVAATIAIESVQQSEKDRNATNQAQTFTTKNTNVTQILWLLLLKEFRKMR